MTKKILYVEDDRNNRLLVRQLLENAGYIVVEATDGLSGIKAAQKERPDLILMDIDIPGMDGYETTTSIKGIPGFSDQKGASSVWQAQSPNSPLPKSNHPRQWRGV